MKRQSLSVKHVNRLSFNGNKKTHKVLLNILSPGCFLWAMDYGQLPNISKKNDRTATQFPPAY